jgi:hypothetical protein
MNLFEISFDSFRDEILSVPVPVCPRAGGQALNSCLFYLKRFLKIER